MDWQRFSVLLLSLCGGLWLPVMEASTLADSHYVAGVVEFQTNRNLSDTPKARLQHNLESYLQIITSDDARDTDIIVFPEMTLNSDDELTFVPAVDATHLIAPCEDSNLTKYHTFLVQLSCAARRVRKYIVINLTEKENCVESSTDPRPCAPSGLNIYNTNVVLDREGYVISRYRKWHLYGEAKNTTYRPEFGVFETDFGVRFGHFICFDILFYQPAQEMVEHEGIRDFIYPTMWFSQLPFLTAVQTQSAWAYGNDVNLLTAGASDPERGSTGTGIFNGRNGSLTAVMNRQTGERRIYVHKVPKIPERQRIPKANSLSSNHRRMRRSTTDNIFLKRDYLEEYTTISLNLTEGSHLEQRLCHAQFCCNFELRWHQLDDKQEHYVYYSYRLGAYSGWRNEEAVEKHYIQNCALFACVGADLTTCGRMIPSGTAEVQPQVVFDYISVSANYTKAKEFLLMPNTLKDDLLPLAVTDFTWKDIEHGNIHSTSLELKVSTQNLLTFALYGNYYDGLGDGRDGGGTLKPSLYGFILAFILCLRISCL